MRYAETDHALLLRLYGITEGRRCGDCVFLRRYKTNRSWSKCSKARVTASTASDWRARWQACGQFEEDHPSA